MIIYDVTPVRQRAQGDQSREKIEPKTHATAGYSEKLHRAHNIAKTTGFSTEASKPQQHKAAEAA